MIIESPFTGQICLSDIDLLPNVAALQKLNPALGNQRRLFLLVDGNRKQLDTVGKCLATTNYWRSLAGVKKAFWQASPDRCLVA